MGSKPPQRRCAGCGQVRDKDRLVRLAVATVSGGDPPEAAVVVDRARRMPGRGAYLCSAEGRPSGDCLALAIRRGGIARALRRPGSLDFDDLLESVAA